MAKIGLFPMLLALMYTFNMPGKKLFRCSGNVPVSLVMFIDCSFIEHGIPGKPPYSNPCAHDFPLRYIDEVRDGL
jgi:hypothetical protein